METQHNAFLRVALWSQVIEIKEIECITILHNNLTEAESPVPPVSLNLFLQIIGGIRPVFFTSTHVVHYFSNK
ncbi:hypothetical protein [Leptospira noguchii]|uniref:hypothetical protein n=1 Tax=Leptospira noguchii TaxID=28182 RepID=UPI001FB6BAE2|nr:hypothetical protein [Leptospira noguchii]UOG30636.1 hypothetical protein MAL06_00585 [Leptospira noguchii]